MRTLGARIGLIAFVLWIVAMAAQEWRLTQQVHDLAGKYDDLSVTVAQVVGKYDGLQATVKQMAGKYEQPVKGESVSLGRVQYQIDALSQFLVGVCQAGWFQYNCGLFYGRVGR